MASPGFLDLFSTSGDATPAKVKPIRTAGRLATLRRLGGLLFAALVCLLTGKPALQTFQDDPVDQRMTQDDDNDQSRAAVPEKGKKEERSEEASAPPRGIERRKTAPAADDASFLLDTTQKWDRRKLYRESDGFSGKPAIPFPPRPGIKAEPPKIISLEDPAAELAILRIGKRFFPKSISQEDLTELEILEKRYREAKQRYSRKREKIRLAIENGATVEAGFRSADLEKVLVVR